MRRYISRVALALLASALLLPFTFSLALAHGHTEVGDYELVIGFKNEPAYQGEPNGLDLTVTNKQTGEKVNDLADTLKVELIYGASKRSLELRPQWGQDGAYTADVLPTEAGDYTWHISGEINGTPLDVSMTSSPDTFGAVQAKNEVSFPAADASPAELRAAAADAARTAQAALLVGGLGVLLGLAGLVAAVLALRSRVSAATPTRQPQRSA